MKVTVHIGTDQNIKIEIFAEYKYTLNELPVKIIFFFNTSNSLRDTGRVYKVVLWHGRCEPSGVL